MRTKTKPETDEDRGCRFEKKFTELRDKYDDKMLVVLDGEQVDWSYVWASALNNAAETEDYRERWMGGTIEQHANYWDCAYGTLAMHVDQMVIL